MEDLLSKLPTIYVYWASALMVWSMVICLLQTKIISVSMETGNYFRKSDIIIGGTVAVGAVCLFISIFMIPQYTVLFIEIALLLALWYTVFLTAISHIGIICWVNFRRTRVFNENLIPTFKFRSN